MTERQYQHIVMVDDSADDIFIAEHSLKRAGYAGRFQGFFEASDALTFLQSEAAAEVDLIIVDINMPRMSGFEFATLLTALTLPQRYHLVISSGSADPRDLARCAEHGAIDGFACKPISIALLQGEGFFEQAPSG